MQRHHSTVSILLQVLSATMGTVLMGYQMGVYNSTSDVVDIEFNLHKSNQAIITAIVPIGAMLGALFCNLLNKQPRRLVFILTDVLTLAGLGLTVVVQYWSLLLGRGVVGFAIGINTTLIPVFINELSPVQVNGLMGSCFQTMCNVGFLLVFMMGINVQTGAEYKEQSTSQWWRIMFLFPAITSVIRIFAFLFVYTHDTPDYYVMTNQKEKAE